MFQIFSISVLHRTIRNTIKLQKETQKSAAINNIDLIDNHGLEIASVTGTMTYGALCLVLSFVITLPTLWKFTPDMSGFAGY